MAKSFEEIRRETQKIEQQRVNHKRKLSGRIYQSFLSELHPENSMFSAPSSPKKDDKEVETPQIEGAQSLTVEEELKQKRERRRSRTFDIK